MKNPFHRLRWRLFPPVGKRRARQIARRACVPGAGEFEVFDRRPASCSFYGEPSEPCWWILGPWNDGRDGRMLRSSHLLLVSKTSGKILFDGSARDEG